MTDSPRRCSNDERRSRLLSQCRSLPATSPTLPRSTLQQLSKHLLVDDAHRLILCSPPKAGATSIRTLLVLSSAEYAWQSSGTGSDALRHRLSHVHSESVLDRFGIRSLASYTQPQIIHRLTNYYKIVVVRHPLSRLLSMFRNKLEGSSPGACAGFKATLGAWIVKEMRNISLARGECASDLTFPEFTSFLRKNALVLSKEPHVTRVHEYCAVCRLQYDYIAKLETLDSDQQFIIDSVLKPDDELNLHPLNLNVNTRNMTQRSAEIPAQRYASDVREFARLDDYLVDFLLEHYKTDMTLFGYDVKRSNQRLNDMLATCSGGGGGERCC